MRVSEANTTADGFLAFSFVMLINVVPLQKSVSRQTTQIYIWTAVIFILYSLLFSLFRIKNRGAVKLTNPFSSYLRVSRISIQASSVVLEAIAECIQLDNGHHVGSRTRTMSQPSSSKEIFLFI